jgi:hypothetical protein
MRSWRSDRTLGRAAAGAALLLALWAPPAPAQLGPPVRLQTPPGAGTGPTIPPPLATGTPTTDESIKATPLAPEDAAWIGALPDGTQPLPQAMWARTPRPIVAAALPLLGPTASPALQDLSRRLLLSNAAAPLGPDPADRPSLAELRVERLVALGEIDGALAVLDRLPSSMRTDELERRRVELDFAKNDVQAGCRQVQESAARHQATWWDRALIACQALAGDREQASLGLSLLKERNAPPDPVFDALVGAAGGRAIKLDKLAEPTPILVTLLAAAKLLLPADAVATGDLASLRSWAGNPAVPPLQRLAAAERATALGALPPEALAELYAKVEVKPDELGAAIKRSKAPASPRDRALLYQLARTDPSDAVRASALLALLAEAKKRGAFLTMARVIAPILLELAPSDQLKACAADFSRALLAAGRPDAVMPWMTYLDEFGVASSIYSMTMIASRKQPTSDELKGGLRTALKNSAPPEPGSALLLALASALGEDIPSEWWISHIAEPHTATIPSVALWLDQQRAATEKRIGETVLTTLILARDGDRLTGEPVVLARIVAGLELVGLDSEARAVAVEAALDAGL